LLEPSYSQIGPQPAFAAIGFDLALQYAQKSRFADTIASDKTNTLATVDLQIDPIKQDLLAVMQRNVIQSYQGQ
jgi:hypothetical protein